MEIVLSVGSNRSCDDINKALIWLKKQIKNFRTSKIYTSPCYNGHNRPYVNAVVSGTTQLSKEMFNLKLKEYEYKSGRTEEARNQGIVPIDIDIVIWDGEIIRMRDYTASFFKIGYSELSGS